MKQSRHRELQIVNILMEVEGGRLVRELTESWITEYNNEQPQDSMDDLTPWEYPAKHKRAENSNQWCC